MYQKPIRLLDETLLDSAQSLPDKPALIADGNEHTYEELTATAARIGAALRDRGVRRGDRVAIYQENGFLCAASVYGALMAGAVFLVVNTQTRTDKLRFILDDSEAAALLTGNGLATSFLPAIEGSHSLHAVFCSGGQSDGKTTEAPAVESLEGIIDSTPPLDAPVFHIPTDLAALIYTSGSSGNPKGVMMTHGAMVFAAGSLIEYLRLDANQRILNFLPLAFDYGLYQLLMSVYLGATLVLERSFAYPAEILARVAEQRVTVFPGVPTAFAIIVGMHRRTPLHCPSILRVTNTAAALPAAYTPDLRAIFPNALIYRMYGLTECKRVCYLDPQLVDEKPESVGKAIPGTETLLLSEKGVPVKAGEAGILHVRGPHVMMGYWRRPDLTREMLREGPIPGERMLCAQDWFTMDEDGDLYFLGRSDDIIKTGGEKVSPVEVENALYSIVGVRQAAVIGIRDELLGQAVKAIVVLEEGARLTERDILRGCAAKLESFMMPRYVEFRTELPQTATGKIRKKGLA